MTLWFRGSNDPSDRTRIKETVLLLYPNKVASSVRQNDRRSRFSQLLLEHGEKPIQDWAIVANSSPTTLFPQQSSTNSNNKNASPSIQWEQNPNKSSKTRKQQSSNRDKKQDTSKDASPTAHMAQWQGRLHLCSRSLVFEPTSSSYPIIRCPFQKLQSEPAGYDQTVEWISQKHIAIHAVAAPYVTVSHPVHFRIELLHSSPQSLLEQAKKLFESCQQPGHQHAQFEATTKPSTPVDPTILHVREQFMANPMPCKWLTPLQSTDGVLILTNERLSFQNTSGTTSFWYLDQVAATARRYSGLRDCALEIYWKGGASVLLALDRRHEREQVLRQLHHVPCVTNRDFLLQVIHAWHKNELDNFEYLLALNSAAGRSFHDLSRYPVFPWVLSDYTSEKLDLKNPAMFRDMQKPVGALNPERLEYFRNRLSNMQDMGEKFLYGTHYSAPGYVLYFLVRSMPEHMLCLQNGKFDAADRMFHSVAQCYQCVLTNHADVKELIPEFFSTDFDFLINARGLQLGATQNGERVNDVKLPQWARSARDFLRKNRKALESDLCTKALPRWIDLIFGCTARGEAAMAAANLFHHTAYLGPNDLAAMQSEKERFQAELQATEFGIIPDQLFISPHPNRESQFAEDFVSPDIGRASSKDDSGREAWELLDPPSSHDDGPRVPEAPVIDTNSTSKSWSSAGVSGKDPLSPEQQIKSKRSPVEEASDSVPPGSLVTPGRPASSQSTKSPQQEPSPIQQLTTTKDSSSWQMDVLEQQQIHNDAISGCQLLVNALENKKSILATTSLDGGLKVHSVSLTTQSTDAKDLIASTFSRFAYNNIMNRNQPSGSSQNSKLVEYRTHSSRDPLASLVLALDGVGGSVAFAGGHDDVVLAYGINSACAVASVYSHRDAVTGLDLIPRSPFDSGSALWLENATHIMISGSWDATVKVWSASVSGGETVSVNREPIAELFDADSSIVCVSAISIPTGGIVIGAGCADGSFCVWNIHNDGVQVVIHNEPAKRGSGPCSVVKWVSSGGTLNMFAAFSTGKVASYVLLDGVKLERRNAVSVGVPVSALVFSDGFLLVGCGDGGLRLIPIREGCYFEAKPTLWAAVNNKSAPGITSISLTRSMTANGEAEGRYICCTGAQDGSVALFELKRING